MNESMEPKWRKQEDELQQGKKNRVSQGNVFGLMRLEHENRPVHLCCTSSPQKRSTSTMKVPSQQMDETLRSCKRKVAC